jgi:hypothetical protein
LSIEKLAATYPLQISAMRSIHPIATVLRPGYLTAWRMFAFARRIELSWSPTSPANLTSTCLIYWNQPQWRSNVLAKLGIGAMERVLLAVVTIAWLVAEMVLASFNRKNLRIFAACVLVAVAALIVFNVLLLTGQIKP